ncbi:MAG: MarR family transcriptional regulator, partial [Acidimicrobiales bacterium]
MTGRTTGPRRSPGSLTDQDYRDILVFRDQLRRFLAWSEDQARSAGLTPAQHQLLLAVRGHPGPERPTIGDLADHLRLRHHSAVGLVDRAEAAGLVRRVADRDDRRVVRIALRPAGDAALAHLTALHLTELAV